MDDVVQIDFQASSDYLLATIAARNETLLFTFKNGFVYIESGLDESK